MSGVKRAATAGQDKESRTDQDRTRCAFEVSGIRCKYPGTMSPINWNGEGQHPGPWYCRLHWQCSSPAVGWDIIEASQDYVPEGNEVQAVKARLEKQALAEAAAYCVEHGISTREEMFAVWRGFKGKRNAS